MGADNKKMQQQKEFEEINEIGKINEEEEGVEIPLTRTYCTAQMLASLTVFTYATLQLGTAYMRMQHPIELLFPLLWFFFLAPAGFIGAVQWRQTRRRMALAQTVTNTPASAFFAATVFAILAVVKTIIYLSMGYNMIPVTFFFYLMSLFFFLKHYYDVSQMPKKKRDV
jgi:hypothetical protein